MTKKTGIALIVIAIIAIGGLFLPGVRTTVVENLGSNPGPDFYSAVSFKGGVSFGRSLSTSTPASLTLKVSDVQDFDTVIVRPTGAASSKTLTFFASSTASSWLPVAGDSQTTCFLNATTTSGVTLVFAGGTGIDLQTASSSPTDLTILPDNTACFRFIRKSQVAGVTNAFDIEASMTEYTDGD
jgi:hypothetical protein